MTSFCVKPLAGAAGKQNRSPHWDLVFPGRTLSWTRRTAEHQQRPLSLPAAAACGADLTWIHFVRLLLRFVHPLARESSLCTRFFSFSSPLCTVMTDPRAFQKEKLTPANDQSQLLSPVFQSGLFLVERWPVGRMLCCMSVLVYQDCSRKNSDPFDRQE